MDDLVCKPIENFMHILQFISCTQKFSRVIFARKPCFCVVFAPLFCAEEFSILIFQGSLHFTWVFIGKMHSEATRTSSKMGISEVGGRWDEQTTKEDGAGEENFRGGSTKKSHRKLLWQEFTKEKGGKA